MRDTTKIKARSAPSLLALCVVLTAAPVGSIAKAGPSPSCALVNSIDAWQEADEATVVIETSPSQKFRIEFTAPCRETSNSLVAHIETRRGGGICLIPGDTIVFGRGQTVAFEHYEFEERCTIKTIEPVIAGGPEIGPLPPQ